MRIDKISGIKLPVEFIFSCTNNLHNDTKLGEGAFGAVYKGKDDNRYFAVKRICFDFAVKENKKSRNLARVLKLNWR